jgi:hypothetical protein
VMPTKLKKPRTCYRCAAFVYYTDRPSVCESGYAVVEHLPHAFRPGGPCPKPTTIKEFMKTPKKWEVADGHG